MRYSELLPGDVLACEPLGKYTVWMYVRDIGPRVGWFLNLTTGSLEEALHDNTEIDKEWTVLRGGQVVKEGA